MRRRSTESNMKSKDVGKDRRTEHSVCEYIANSPQPISSSHSGQSHTKSHLNSEL